MGTPALPAPPHTPPQGSGSIAGGRGGEKNVRVGGREEGCGMLPSAPDRGSHSHELPAAVVTSARLTGPASQSHSVDGVMIASPSRPSLSSYGGGYLLGKGGCGPAPGIPLLQ